MKKTSEAESIFANYLSEFGFCNSNIDLRLWLDTFISFAKSESFDADDQMIFWECGAFDFSGELLFYCSLTWQFSLYDSDGSYDHMEQLHFSICYPPEPKLKGLKECLWSYEFEDNLDLFGEAIRNHKIFQLLLNNTPIKYEMYWEMV